jgi:hypothetical protein
MCKEVQENKNRVIDGNIRTQVKRRKIFHPKFDRTVLHHLAHPAAHQASELTQYSNRTLR